jgi:hypothetical protein
MHGPGSLNLPRESLIALDILSIPAMSAEPERLFSGAKITITDCRNRLGIESIKAIECLKSWLSTGSIVAFANNAIDTKLPDADKDILHS